MISRADRRRAAPIVLICPRMPPPRSSRRAGRTSSSSTGASAATCRCTPIAPSALAPRARASSSVASSASASSSACRRSHVASPSSTRRSAARWACVAARSASSARRRASRRRNIDHLWTRYSYPPTRHRRDSDSTHRCIKHQGQCCCIVENIALPCDSEIPMYRGGVLVGMPSTDWRNGSASD